MPTGHALCESDSYIDTIGGRKDMQVFSGQQFAFSTDGSSTRAQIQQFVGPANFATAVLEGFDVEFQPRNDHSFGRLVVVLETEQSGNAVTIFATFALRDWSGGDDALNGDDPIRGTIFYSVFIG